MAICFEILILGISKILEAAAEPREGMIELMMKRLGVQRSVLVTRDLTYNGIYCLVFSTLVTLLLYFLGGWSDSIGFFTLLIFAYLTQAQSIVRQTIISNVMSRTMGFLLVSIFMLI